MTSDMGEPMATSSDSLNKVFGSEISRLETHFYASNNLGKSKTAAFPKRSVSYLYGTQIMQTVLNWMPHRNSRRFHNFLVLQIL